MKRLMVVVPLALILCAGSQAAERSGPALAGSWIGTYTLNGPGQVSLVVGGGRAVVALGVGHADVQTVSAKVSGEHIRFQLPGRPAPLVFDARLVSGRLVGAVGQGAARGTFRARRGTAPELVARGLYAVGGACPGRRRRSLRAGEARRSRIRCGAWAVPSRCRRLRSAQGSRPVTRREAPLGSMPREQSWRGRLRPRRRLRQLEVRFSSGGAMLSGTLTLPSGPGRHPAVAFVHGSGSTERAYLPDLQALLVRNGVAVLAYDKRGVGQSGGSYPGESPTAAAIDVLARDAAAASRFLRSQPEIDPARVGSRRAQPGRLDHAAGRVARRRESAFSSSSRGRL